MTVSTSPALPLAVVERIDAVCDRFEAAWKAGLRPQIDDYLSAEAGPERDALLRELRRVTEHYEMRSVTGRGPRPIHHDFLRERLSGAGYQILGELGRGGMGVVYKARQQRPNRIVAIKMISADATVGERELDRFRREAEAVAQLQHPNIVQVYEVGEVDGHPYFALEYVAGGSLDRKLAGAPQPPHAAAEMVEKLAEAIHHAHQRGIIHRDLKPANVLLVGRDVDEADGSAGPLRPYTPLGDYEPKITDFGLAKLLDPSGAHPTQTTDLLGTPSYMAPEQVSGGSAGISAATDVYGLGAILYELLTGRPPFRGDTVLETVFQVQSAEPVSPSRLQPRCPRDLVTICLKCMSKSPRQRYASAAELADDLRRFLNGQPIRARPVGPLQQAFKWTRRQPVVASLVALLILAITLGAATGSWFWWQAEDGLKQTEAALTRERSAQAERVATVDRYQVALAHREWLENDSGRAAELLDACTEEQRKAWEWRYLDRLRRSALFSFAGHTNLVRTLAIHPTGSHAASAGHDGSVRVWDLQTGRGMELGTHPDSLVLGLAYSPDGKLLASSDSHHGRIRLWDLASGTVRELLFGGVGEVAVTGVAFDASGRYLAACGRRQVKIWDTHNQQLAYEWEAHRGEIQQVVFSRDGRWLATASSDIRVWDWQTNRTTPTHAWRGHRTRTHDLAFSPDGKLLASGGRDGMVRVHSLETGREEYSLDAHQLFVTSVCFSPDGTRLASAGQEGDMHVWHVAERRRLFTLHGHSGAVWDLAYTPDGERLVSAGADFLVQVWDAVSGQESTTLPFIIAGEVTALSFGPAGRLIGWGNIRGSAGVWDTSLAREVFRLDSPAPNRRTRVGSMVVDPAARRVAWWQWDAPPSLWDLTSGKEIVLADVGKRQVVGVAFTEDGKRLLGALWLDGELLVRDLMTGEQLLKLPRTERTVTQAVWTADARRFVTLEDRRYARLWDTRSGRLLGEFEHQPAVRRVAFSGDGKLLAMGGIDGRFSVWDLQKRQKLMSTEGHAANLHGLALSPDGSRLISSAADSTAKLWDTRSGHEVLALRTHLHENSLVAFSPNGQDIVSVNVDNRLQIWSAGDGQTTVPRTSKSVGR